MSEKKVKNGEAGWIAEEVFKDGAMQLRVKCLAIDDQVTRGVLDLTDALEVYEIPLNDYLEFFIKEQNAQADARFHGMPAAIQAHVRLRYASLYFNSFISLMYHSPLIDRISNNIDKLEDDIGKGKIKVLNE